MSDRSAHLIAAHRPIPSARWAGRGGERHGDYFSDTADRHAPPRSAYNHDRQRDIRTHTKSRQRYTLTAPYFLPARTCGAGPKPFVLQVYPVVLKRQMKRQRPTTTTRSNRGIE